MGYNGEQALMLGLFCRRQVCLAATYGSSQGGGQQQSVPARLVVSAGAKVQVHPDRLAT